MNTTGDTQWEGKEPAHWDNDTRVRTIKWGRGRSWRSQWGFKVNNATMKENIWFFSRPGTIFLEAPGQKTYFPISVTDFLGKINISYNQEQRKRQGNHAVNPVTREQPKKFSSAGDNVCMQRWRWVGSKAERESKLENLWGKDGNNGTQIACRGGLNPRECRRKQSSRK